MLPAPGRRDVLRLLIGSGAGVALGATSFPRAARAQAGHPTITATRLTDTLILLSGAGGNVVLAVGSDRVVLIDGGLRERSADVLAAVDTHAPGRRVDTLFNTDWHPEHTGSNEALGGAGTTIIAHEHTKQYLGARMFVDWQARTYEPLATPGLPTETFYDAGTLELGQDRVEYGHLGQAHTDGDIYAFFPESNVLVAGDVLTVGAYPIADYTTGGWLGGLANATKALMDLADAGTRVVPGVGPLQTRADLEMQHEMLVTLRERLGKMMKQGMGAEDMLAAGATGEFDHRWGDPALFLSTTYRGMWLHVRELGGIV
jgi:glyoxylase-like metal-dependent hydrolase (beta-lactamase superfamily II)